MTCVGGYWFWFFLRVDVSAEAHPWYRIITADLFVLALLACATFGLAWSFLQSFVIAMVLLIIIGTGLDMLHKKNVVYFFRNAQKAKKSAKTELSTGKKTAVILKTVASDIATTSELGFGKRRLAHVLGMYGTILFWICLLYTSPSPRDRG